MEIDGHPPIPLAQNNSLLWQFPSYFSTVFWIPNFRGYFEALNDMFCYSGGKLMPMACIWPQTKDVRLG